MKVGDNIVLSFNTSFIIRLGRLGQVIHALRPAPFIAHLDLGSMRLTSEGETELSKEYNERLL